MILSQWRKARSITQVEMARKLGITQSMLSKIENGLTPSFAVAKTIAQTTGLEIGELFPKYKI